MKRRQQPTAGLMGEYVGRQSREPYEKHINIRAGTYVQDIQYAGFAGAKTSDAVIGLKGQLMELSARFPQEISSDRMQSL